MNLNFKTRIALNYMVASAILMALVFSGIFWVVRKTVYTNLDDDLNFEAQKHTAEIAVKNDSIYFYFKKELEEREHVEVQVNPVFIQLSGKDGTLFDKSPNLKEEQLRILSSDKDEQHYTTSLSGQPIRQVQMPIKKNGKPVGYVLAAMSLEASQTVLNKLQNTLLLLFPVILLVIFLISRFLAGRSIAPIQSIISTTNTITRNNLDERIVLPQKKDELYKLSAAINELLERIKKALDRERQFTSDASHELRTPLSSLRGTLEVLIRKPRKPAEYEEKVDFALSVIDKMSNTLEQLLIMARMEASPKPLNNGRVPLPTLIDEILSEYNTEISNKNLHIKLNIDTSSETKVSRYYATLILQNTIENAIKYSGENGVISISLQRDGQHVVCTVKDNGIGIKKEDLNKVFDSFYRSDALAHKNIFGSGLGLPIAKKSAEVIGAGLSIESELHKGTAVHITF